MNATNKVIATFNFAGTTISYSAAGVTSQAGRVPEVITQAVRMMMKYKILAMTIDNAVVTRNIDA